MAGITDRSGSITQINFTLAWDVKVLPMLESLKSIFFVCFVTADNSLAFAIPDADIPRNFWTSGKCPGAIMIMPERLVRLAP